MAQQQYGLPVWGGGGIDPSMGAGGSDLFSTAGHGPPVASPAKTLPQRPTIAYNPAENMMFVNGMVFKADDYAAMAGSPEQLTRPPVPKPANGAWHDVPMSSYEGLVNEIKDPSLSVVAKRNFQQALYGMQEIGYGAIGAASGAVGADNVQNWAGRGAAQALTQQERFAPFNYQFGSAEDDSNVKAFVGAVAQAAPWLVESVVSGGTGALAGIGGRALLKGSIKKVLANESINSAEKEALVLASRTARTTGALAGIGASSYATGVGDVYNESVAGGQPDPSGALLRGIPYGLTDALPEVGALAIGMGKAGALSRYIGGTKLPYRVAAGAIGGGIGEGINEAVQERILTGERESVQPGYSELSEEEGGPGNRILQAGLGGAAPGMLLGGFASGVGGRKSLRTQLNTNPNVQTDLLKAQQPVPAKTAVSPTPSVQGQLDLQGGVAGAPSGQFGTAPGQRVQFYQPEGLSPEEQARQRPLIPDDYALQPSPQYSNPILAIQARQGVNPDQRQAADAPDTRSGNLFAGEQLSLLPDPAQVIPQGQQSLMPDRRGSGVYTPLSGVPAGQQELKFPKAAALKKGQQPKTETPTVGSMSQPAAPSVQPIVSNKMQAIADAIQPHALPGSREQMMSQYQTGKAISDAKQSALKESKALAPKKALKKSLPETPAQKVELSPPVNEPTRNDAAVEDNFSGERFAQQTLTEAEAAKTDLQWFNSVQQAIKKKPSLAEAIKGYVDDLAPGAAAKYESWVEGNKEDDKLVSRPKRVYSGKIDKVGGRVVASTTKAAEAAVEATPEGKLHDLIRNKHNLQSKEAFVSKVKEAYTSVVNKAYMVGQHKLSDYFTEGEPNVIRTNNRNVLVPFKVTEESKAEFTQREKALREELGVVAQEAHEEDAAEATRIANDYAAEQAADDMSLDDAADRWNTNSYVNADTGEPVVRMSVGRIRLRVAQTLGKFKLVPKTIVVDSFKDLPAFIRNDERIQGDQKNLSGVSFRDQVYVIADQIYSDDHLRSVLLHEVLGHFGFRSVVDSEVLQRIFDDVYDNDPIIRAEADALRDSGRYSGRENWQLVEEALAERAPEVPNTIIQRLWNVIKGALSRLGFDVESYHEPGALARGLLRASYRYVHDGVQNDVIGHRPSSWANDIMAANNAPAVGPILSEETVIKMIKLGGFNQRKAIMEGLKTTYSKTALKANVPNYFRDLLNNVKSVNQVARKSGGFRRVFEIFQRETRRIHELLNQYNDDTKLLHSPDFTPAEQAVLGKLLSQTTRAKLQSLSDADIRELNLLVAKPDGGVSIDEAILQKLKEMGKFTIADFAKGIEIQYTTERALSPADIAANTAAMKAAVKKIEDLANVRVAAATDPNAKKDIIRQQKKDVTATEAKFAAKVVDGVELVKHKIREAPIQIDPKGQVWKAYNVARDTLDQGQIDILLAKHTMHKQEAAHVFERAMQRLENLKRGAPSKVTRTFAKDISTTYNTLMNTDRTTDPITGRVVLDPAALGRADSMLNAVGRALYKDEALKDLLAYFPQEHVDKLAEQIKHIRDLNKDISETSYTVRAWDFIAGLRTEFTELLGMEEAEMYAKRSIAGGHVALRRYGNYEVNIVLRDANERVVIPSENWDNNLMYMRFNDQGSAEVTAADMNRDLDGITFEVVDEDGQKVTVTPTAYASAADTIAPLGHKISLYDFMTVADRLGVHLSAKDRETVVKALTKADSKARRSLQRGGNPGEDKDMVRVVSEQLESTAHIVANNENRRELDRLMADHDTWFGNPAELVRLTSARDSATRIETKTKYQKLIDQYKLEYGDSKSVYYYKSLANNLREWRAAQSSLLAKEESKLLANSKSLVSAMQLGGYAANIASAAVQLFTLVTHVPAYLAYYNPKTAFGGGFGPARSYTAVVAASRDVGNYNLGNYGKLLQKIKTLNLTASEREFMLTETKEGVFQAAQFNALMNSKLGTFRFFGQSNRTQALMQKWMQFFSWSEEANRRITGLAAYRLYYERAIQAGETKEAAHTLASSEARQAVYQTQGDYSLLNRPAWARSGFTSLLFMYKMFPILTVQLVRNMPWAGRGMFCGMMLLLGGFKSLPFAEDILDILDGVVQRTGLGSSVTRGNAELALREFVDSMLPGMSPVAARGLLDYMTGAALSARIGVGDIIPGTGFMRAGAGVGTAAQDLQGPAGGVITSLYKMTTEALKGNYAKALRENPVTAAKNVIEGYIYLNNGAILNKRGYVVANDPTVGETIRRFMGFYPERQVASNEEIESAKISINYAKEIKANFVSRYVSARLDGDTERVARINDEVTAWNEDAKGTELEIRAFGTAAARAFAAAKRPQAQTFLRSAPTQIRSQRAHLEALFGVEND